MKNKHYLLLGILFYVFIIAIPCTAYNKLQITYIANEGFLLKSSSHKILIDALFKDGYGGFATPGKLMMNDIMNGIAPFDSINSVFLTHYHKDHCDSELINQYLTKHKKTLFVASQPSLSFIDTECFGFVAKQSQICEITPALNMSVEKNIGGLHTKAYGLKHLSYFVNGVDWDQYMYNISYLIDMDGIKVFHSGDVTESSFQNYVDKHKKWIDKVDVAFIYYQIFDSGVEPLKHIINILHPKYIVLMHIPPKDIDKWEIKAEKLRTTFHNIILFKDEGNSQVITIENNK
jgi:L-ascorbate metabolism protein UlaG (beta-lactamase superfamily)